jgi:hypothetical protein
MKAGITGQAEEDQRRLKEVHNVSTGGTSRHSIGQLSRTHKNSTKTKNPKDEAETDSSLEANRFQKWQETWNMISSRTGITEPEIFFTRYSNGGALLDQIKNLQKSSEMKLEMLKQESLDVESELENVRFDTSFAGGGLSTKEKHKELNEKRQSERRSKEKAEAVEELLQSGLSGFVHISELVGIPPREEGAPAVDVIRDVEAVMEVLLEEQEKQHQIGQNTSSSGSVNHGSSGMVPPPGGLANETIRAPELEAALQRFEGSKHLTAKVQTSKEKMDITSAVGYVAGAVDAEEEEDDEDAGMWDRKFVKTQSQKGVRVALKKASRLLKEAE